MIEEHIPVGCENAISRRGLCAITGMNDRSVRQLISDASKRGILIINVGNGYFIPGDTDDDKDALEYYYNRERKKAIDLLARLKIARLAINLDENQLSLEDL